MNKKIFKAKSFGTVCIIWHVSNNYPRIAHILLSGPELSSEKQAEIIFPDSRISSCTEIDAIADSIKAYLEGEDVKFSLNIVDLSLCSKFQQSVLRAQYAIPRGSVSTYGLIAAHVGAPDGARAVGNALAGNPFPIIVPCHRTVLSNLHLGGFQSGVEMKRVLLEREGICFDHAGRVTANAIHEYFSKK